MFRPVSALLVTAVVIAATASAFAQTNPIPESPVPGFGGHDTRPGNPGGSPSASGSDIGSNVGTGASASPFVDIITLSTSQTVGNDIKPPAATSGSVTVTR